MSNSFKRPLPCSSVKMAPCHEQLHSIHFRNLSMCSENIGLIELMGVLQRSGQWAFKNVTQNSLPCYTVWYRSNADTDKLSGNLAMLAENFKEKPRIGISVRRIFKIPDLLAEESFTFYMSVSKMTIFQVFEKKIF